jgi:amidohydrolase
VDVDRLKQRVAQQIDDSAQAIIDFGKDILKHPELGYKEFRTSGRVKRFMQDLGLTVQDGFAVTGLRSDFRENAGPIVAILGELDAVLCPEHPFADKTTGAAHACGHNVQVSAMLGSALGLLKSGAMAELAGGVALIAVPSEEFVEIEFRRGLREAGKIEFLAGKQEMVKDAAFDGIDAAVMIHTDSSTTQPSVRAGGSSNGFMGKTARFLGKEAHAGGSPHTGINALSAANIAFMSIQAQRETFRDADVVRVHPIFTKGGDLVNIIPAEVKLEMHVRARTAEAMMDAVRKVDRALRAGAVAMGAVVEIHTLTGHLPLVNDPSLVDLFLANEARLVPAQHLNRVPDTEVSGGTTDIGDISQLMPAVHPHVGGVLGAGHSKDYEVVNEAHAYINSAKAMAFMAIDLLADGAQKMNEIKAAHKPIYTKSEYLALLRKGFSFEKFNGASVTGP